MPIKINLGGKTKLAKALKKMEDKNKVVDSPDALPNASTKSVHSPIELETNEPEILEPFVLPSVTKKIAGVSSVDDVGAVFKLAVKDELEAKLIQGAALVKLRELMPTIDADDYYDFVEKNYGVRVRKAQYLIAVFNFVAKSKIDSEKLAKLSWTKIRELASKIEPELLGHYAETTEKLTVVELKKKLTKEFPSKFTTHEETKFKTVSVSMPLDHLEVHEAAIQLIKDRSGNPSMTDSQAMYLMETEWLANDDGYYGKEFAEAVLPVVIQILGKKGTASFIESYSPEPTAMESLKSQM